MYINFFISKPPLAPPGVRNGNLCLFFKSIIHISSHSLVLFSLDQVHIRAFLHFRLRSSDFQPPTFFLIHKIPVFSNRGSETATPIFAHSLIFLLPSKFISYSTVATFQPGKFSNLLVLGRLLLFLFQMVSNFRYTDR